jgi:hypothetical protein
MNPTNQRRTGNKEATDYLSATYVMACSVHHFMKRINQGLIECISGKSAINLHVPKGWLDGAASLDDCFHGLCRPPLA